MWQRMSFWKTMCRWQLFQLIFELKHIPVYVNTFSCIQSTVISPHFNKSHILKHADYFTYLFTFLILFRSGTGIRFGDAKWSRDC